MASLPGCVIWPFSRLKKKAVEPGRESKISHSLTITTQRNKVKSRGETEWGFSLRRKETYVFVPRFYLFIYLFREGERERERERERASFEILEQKERRYSTWSLNTNLDLPTELSSYNEEELFDSRYSVFPVDSRTFSWQKCPHSTKLKKNLY